MSLQWNACTLHLLTARSLPEARSGVDYRHRGTVTESVVAKSVNRAVDVSQLQPVVERRQRGLLASPSVAARRDVSDLNRRPGFTVGRHAQFAGAHSSMGPLAHEMRRRIHQKQNVPKMTARPRNIAISYPWKAQ